MVTGAQVDPVVRQKLSVLHHKGILGLFQDPEHHVSVQRFERGYDGHSSYELRDHSEPDDFLLADLLYLSVFVLLYIRAESECNRSFLVFFFCEFFYSRKSPTGYKEDVRCIHLYKLLHWVSPVSFSRHRGNGPFHDLQQRLLHSFPGYVLCL
jgi:hypothetical protein